MITEYEKMRSQKMAEYTIEELGEMLNRMKKKVFELNTETYLHAPNYREKLKQVLPTIPDSSDIVPPFFCDYGDGIVIGEHTFINFNCTFLDGATITIGSHVFIGPNVQIYTPQHPMDYMRRRTLEEINEPVVIGNDCWIGGGTVILPGVTVGDRCVIGAGSVVVKDIPSDSVAVGNPAKVIRRS